MPSEENSPSRAIPRDLVLLTHQYPYAIGDAPFVESEISSLADAFERVYIWTLRDSRGLRLRTPENVEVVGSLLGGATEVRLLLRALRYPRPFFGLMWREMRARGRKVQWPRLARSAAIAVVGGSTLESWLEKRNGSGRDFVLYAFWGTDCASATLTLTERPVFFAVRMHGYDLYEERVTYLPFRRPLLDRADVVLTVSQHGANYLEKVYASSRSLPAIVVARLGTPDLGAGPGAPSDVVRVVSCSSLVDLKRVDFIFEVVNKLAESRRVDWVHFGDGPLRNDLDAKIATRAPNLRIELRGQASREDILAYYQSVEISFFINLSTTEGVPVSIMEALSFGIPVLATDVGGTSEIVSRAQGNGVLVSPQADLVEVVRSADELLDARLDGARDSWERRSNGETNGRAVASLLATGVTRGGGSEVPSSV